VAEENAGTTGAAVVVVEDVFPTFSIMRAMSDV